jgi:hypothetical protein
MQLVAQPWIYDFGTATGSFNSSSSTSGFLPDPLSGSDQVRVGDTGGSFDLVNPGGLDSELQITAASGSGPIGGTGVINKFSVYDYTPGTSFSIGFKIRFECDASDNGIAYFFIGDGDYFTNDTRYIGTDLYTGIRWTKVAGNSQLVTAILNSTGSGYESLSNGFFINTEYFVEIFGNNTGSEINYEYNGTQTLSAYSYDLWIDGTQAVDDRPKSLNTMDNGDPIDSYMILAEGSTNNQLVVIVDDFKYSNQVEDVLSGTNGEVSGTVSSSGTGLEGIEVELTDLDGFAIPGIDAILTSGDGSYTFPDLDPASYQVGIVVPLGYGLDPLYANPALVTVLPGETTIADFHLQEVALSNTARGRYYWKKQFALHIHGYGWLAQEAEAELITYIEHVHQYYTPHFDIFEGLTTFGDWIDLLRFRWHPSKRLERAKAQLASLILNFTSLKISQNEIVTYDNRTAGDVLTYCSVLISNPNATSDELILAKILARKVNWHQMIGAGIVPDGGLLYKGLMESIDWSFGAPTDYTLSQNYPNPFNPLTKIKYSIPQSSNIVIKVFDILGNEIETLVNEEKQAGTYEITWNAAGLTSGVYFYHLKVGDFVETKKMILMK